MALRVAGRSRHGTGSGRRIRDLEYDVADAGCYFHPCGSAQSAAGTRRPGTMYDRELLLRPDHRSMHMDESRISRVDSRTDTISSWIQSAAAAASGWCPAPCEISALCVTGSNRRSRGSGSPSSLSCRSQSGPGALRDGMKGRTWKSRAVPRSDWHPHARRPPRCQAGGPMSPHH